MRYATWLVLFLCLCPALSQAATYYVSGSQGNNGNSCSNATDAADMTKAKATIKNAMESCWRNPGDILDIRGGSYPETLHSALGTNWPRGGNSWGDAMTMRGHAGETVTINPSASGVDYAIIYFDENNAGGPPNYLILDNLTIDGANLNMSNAMWLVRYLDNADQGRVGRIRIQNSRLINSHASCSGGYPGCGYGVGILSPGNGSEYLNNEFFGNDAYPFYISGPNNLIDGNYMHDNYAYCVHLYHGGGSSDFMADNNIVRNNRCINNGHLNRNTAGSCGLLYATGSNGQMYNNIVVNQGDPFGNGCGIQLYGGTSNIKVYNNTVVSNQSRCIEVSGSGHDIRNNICYNNGSDIGGDGSATLDRNTPNGQNPEFVNLNAGQFQLQESSPFKAYGFIVAPVTVDIDNHMRGTSGVVGQPTAAGAYEFTTGVSVTKAIFFIAPPPSGNDANDCEAAKGTLAAPSTAPKQTLNAALACGAAESTFVLRAGTYIERIDTQSQPIPPGTSWANPTTIMAMTGETVTLQQSSAGVGIFLRNASTDQYIVFDRLILDAGSITNGQGLALYPGANHIRFQNGEIKGNWYEAVLAFNANNFEVLNSTLRQSGSNVTAVVRVTGTGTVSLQGNTIMQGGKEGIRVDSSSAGVVLNANSIHDNAGVGVAVNGSPGLLVSNNLIYDNARGMDVETGASATEVYNNTFWSNTGIGLQILAGASGTLYTNNIFWQNGTDTPSNAGTGTVNTTNLVGNPTFVAPGPPTTFHVSGLNAVGAGTVLAKVTTDFAGVGRTPPYNTIGAYEEGVPPIGPAPPDVVRGLPYATTHFFSY
jgi:Right handed beta helix region